MSNPSSETGDTGLGMAPWGFILGPIELLIQSVVWTVGSSNLPPRPELDPEELDDTARRQR